MKALCVFCGSSTGKNNYYAGKARELGKSLAAAGLELVYGGGSIGLMGVLADAVLDNGGRVTGVIPRFLYDRELGHEGLTELIVVESMHERKMRMAEKSDGFLAMPGGIGTMEELFEVFTWSQLSLIDKPVALYNVNHYFDALLSFLDHMVEEGFLHNRIRSRLIADRDIEKVLVQIQDQF
jgi:uncharacterized protein (TIGR00730 family)